MAGSGGGGGGGGGVTETLEQARIAGDTFFGDVYWSAATEAVFGTVGGGVNQDYLRIYSDKANHLQVFDSTKDGTGVIRPMSWQMGGVEQMHLAADGGLVVGAATGGSEGAGTINVSGNFYVNGTPLGNATNSWTKDGNSFGVDGILGTEDAFSIIFKTAGSMDMVLDHATGVLVLGGVVATDTRFGSLDILYGYRSVNNLMAITIENASNGNIAQSAFALVNDLGHVGALGMYNSNTSSLAGLPNELHVFASDCSLALGTITTSGGENNPIRFILNDAEYGRIQRDPARGHPQFIIGPNGAAFAPGGLDVLTISANFHELASVTVWNNQVGTLAGAQFVAIADGHSTDPSNKGGGFGITSSGWNPDGGIPAGTAWMCGSNVPLVVGTQQNFALTLMTNATVAVTIATDQGVVVGAATGGSKGAGSINVSGDIYKNGTAYTNPDYVFEDWAAGGIAKFADRPGAEDYRRWTLEELETYCRANLRLPGIQDEAMGMFGRADFLLEKVEEIFLHLFDLRDKVSRLSLVAGL